MKIAYFGYTNKGSVRDHNEDSFLCADRLFAGCDDCGLESPMERVTGETPLVFAVADGMGGHESGEVASKMVLEEFSKRIPARLKSSPDMSLSVKDMIVDLHNELNSFAKTTNKHGMGTTLAGCVADDRAFIIFNAGDSKLYRFRNGFLEQITRDHSLAAQTGLNVEKNIITSCVGGGEDDITVDTFDLTNKLKSQDVILICSDGLVDSLSVDDLEQMLNKQSDRLDVLAKEMMETSIQKGSSDNVTCIVLKVHE